MRLFSITIVTIYSTAAFALDGLTLKRTYNDRIWGQTEIYVLPKTNIKSKTRYWLNRASIAEYQVPQFDMLDDNRWSHDQFLKTDDCWFSEIASSYDEEANTLAIQAGSKFYLANKPFIKRLNDYQIDRLHFSLKATYWGNSSETGRRQIDVVCDVDLENLPVDDMAGYIEELITPSFRTSKGPKVD